VDVRVRARARHFHTQTITTFFASLPRQHLTSLVKMSAELTPSKVLHISNLPPDCLSEDLIQFVQPFGKVEFGKSLRTCAARSHCNLYFARLSLFAQQTLPGADRVGLFGECVGCSAGDATKARLLQELSAVFQLQSQSANQPQHLVWHQVSGDPPPRARVFGRPR
jgi:RNA recognition motif-containing protein